MTDVHEPETRSYNMSRIRGKNTKPEVMVRKYLYANGLRFRLYDSLLPGTPDLVLKKYKAVIFINGCFWHGHHGCKYFKIPATKAEWWTAKIDRNRNKDIESLGKLADLGWTTYVIWECELKPKRRDETLLNLANNLRSTNLPLNYHQ